jgi:hypothetical protein
MPRRSAEKDFLVNSQKKDIFISKIKFLLIFANIAPLREKEKITQRRYVRKVDFPTITEQLFLLSFEKNRN